MFTAAKLNPFDASIIKPLDPLYVKDHEEGFLNSAFADITDVVCPLVDTVPRLWILTEDMRVLVGIEHVYQHPEAYLECKETLNSFRQSVMNEAKDEIKKTSGRLEPSETEITNMMNRLGRGHVTLSTKYDPKGNVRPEKAYIAGELYLKEGRWTLNNQSGRYFHVLNGDKIAILHFLRKAQSIINRALKISTDIEMTKDRTPEALWKKMLKKEESKNDEKRTEEERALQLIKKTFKHTLGKGNESSAYGLISKRLNEDKILKQLKELKILKEDTTKIRLQNIIQYFQTPNFTTTISAIIPNAKLLDTLSKLADSLVFIRAIANQAAEVEGTEVKAPSPTVGCNTLIIGRRLSPNEPATVLSQGNPGDSANPSLSPVIASPKTAPLPIILADSNCQDLTPDRSHFVIQ